MKFLAILKDSVREALDSKLLYVMVALSLLFSLFVASTTYRPVPMQEEVEFMTSFLTTMLQSNTQGGAVSFTVTDFERTDSGNKDEPWNGDYRFVYAMKVSGVALPANEQTKLKEDLTPEKMKEHLRQFMPWFENVQVKEAPSADPQDLRFEVETHGTRIKTRQEWFHQPRLFFGLVGVPVPVFPLEAIIRFIGDVIGGWAAGIIMLISTIITAFFIPNMLGKGTVDLLLVKPISRPALFVYKFFGGLTFMVINTIVIMVGIWFGTGLQSGMWVNTFLMCIPIFTFEFAFFYAISAATGVMTRSAVVAILATCAAWAILFIHGFAFWFLIERPRESTPPEQRSVAYVVYDVIHAGLPQYKELDWLTTKMIKKELLKPADSSKPALQEHYEDQVKKLDKEYGTYKWDVSLGVTSIYIVLLLAFCCWWFSTKDY